MYIYILKLDITHLKNIYKIGSTCNINARKWDYVTGNFYEPEYLAHFELIEKNCYEVDTLLRTQWLVDKSVYFGGGIEFYQFEANENPFVVVRNILVANNVLCYSFIGDNIDSRPPKERSEKSYLEDDQYEKSILPDEERANSFWYEDSEEFKLRAYQIAAIHNISETEDNGKVIMPCGTGKTLIMAHISNIYDKVLVLVPSLLLLSQTLKVFEKHTGFSILRVGSIKDATTQKEEIERFLERRSKYLIISTYQSSHLLLDVEFDLINFDEAHRTCGKYKVDGEIDHSYNILLIRYTLGARKLFYTATEKVIDEIKESKDDEDEENDDVDFISMDDERYGRTLFEYKLNEAIDDKYLTDYNIVLIQKNPIDTIRKFFAERRVKKLLIFCNRNRIAGELAQELKNQDFPLTIYLDGTISVRHRNKEIERFKKMNESIIVSCRIFQEGINIPCCDSVMFYDNRESYVDIIQIIGRCLRLYKNKYMSYVFINESNSRKILKTITNDDDRIIQKIRFTKEHLIKGKIVESNIILDFDEGRCKYEVYDRLMQKIFYGDWNKQYNLLVEFVKEKERLPKYMEEYKGEKISQWLTTQKSNYVRGILLEGRKDKLLQISPFQKWTGEYNGETKEWYNWYELLFEYINVNKRLPHERENYKNEKLGKWLSRQKLAYNKGNLLVERKNKLLEIDLFKKWSDEEKRKKTEWHEYYNALLKFIEENKRLPKQKDKYENKKIGKWLDRQKMAFNKNELTEERKSKLLKINLFETWTKQNKKEKKPWSESYNMLMRFIREKERLPKYRERYENERIGQWLVSQKTNYRRNKLSDERRKRLLQIPLFKQWTEKNKYIIST
jgi:superfamily II DNA or RNA helicase